MAAGTANAHAAGADPITSRTTKHLKTRRFTLRSSPRDPPGLEPAYDGRVSDFLHSAFGAHAQACVGILLAVLTTVQTWWWLGPGGPPSKTAIFIVSMEALYFAAYGIIGAALAVIWLDKRTPDA